MSNELIANKSFSFLRQRSAACAYAKKKTSDEAENTLTLIFLRDFRCCFSAFSFALSVSFNYRQLQSVSLMIQLGVLVIIFLLTSIKFSSPFQNCYNGNYLKDRFHLSKDNEKFSSIACKKKLFL